MVASLPVHTLTSGRRWSRRCPLVPQPSHVQPQGGRAVCPGCKTTGPPRTVWPGMGGQKQGAPLPLTEKWFGGRVPDSAGKAQHPPPSCGQGSVRQVGIQPGGAPPAHLAPCRPCAGHAVQGQATVPLWPCVAMGCSPGRPAGLHLRHRVGDTGQGLGSQQSERGAAAVGFTREVHTGTPVGASWSQCLQLVAWPPALTQTGGCPEAAGPVLPAAPRHPLCTAVEARRLVCARLAPAAL